MNWVESIVKGIIAESKSSEEILRKVKEAFPGAEVNMVKVEVGEGEKTQDKSDSKASDSNSPDSHPDEGCDCFLCKFKRLLKDDSYLKSDKFKNSRVYQIVNEELNGYFGDNPIDYLGMFTKLNQDELKNVTELAEILKKYDLNRITSQVCMDNIERIRLNSKS